MLKAIIFDFDYTLGDSTNGIALTSNDNLYEAEQFIALFKEKADSVMVSNTELYAGGDDVKTEKPDPEGLLSVIEDLGAMNEEVLYVGDSLVDARTAENAKVKFAAVLTGTTTKDDFKSYNSMYIGKNISDVYKYILTLE